MIRRSAVSVVAAFAPAARPTAAEDAVEALRRNLPNGAAREHVVLDFLDDDLRETRTALGAIAGWLASVERVLSDPAPSQPQLMSLALASGPAERLDELSCAIASVRRRLAQAAARE